MNHFIGGWDGGPTRRGFGTGFRHYRKATDLNNPGPSNTFLFIGHRWESINLPNFGVEMAGWPDMADLYQFRQDWPAAYHNGAGVLSFADGHVEKRKWRDARTLKPTTNQKGRVPPNSAFPSPGNQDIRWLQERATRPK